MIGVLMELFLVVIGPFNDDLIHAEFIDGGDYKWTIWANGIKIIKAWPSLGGEGTVLLPIAWSNEVGFLHIVEQCLGWAIVQFVL